MPFKWVPNAAGTPAECHDGHFRFCPAIAQLYRFLVKPNGVEAWREAVVGDDALLADGR
jgi:hypothetical protein